MAGRRGWMIGGVGLIISWAALIIISIIQAPPQVAEMASVVAALIGELPAFTTYLVTVLMGCILGILGGFVGSTLGSFRKTKDEA